MTALYIILGIIAAIVLILSIRLTVFIEYREIVDLKVQWLFLKMNILPLISKRKEKEAKEEKKAEELSKKSDKAAENAEPAAVETAAAPEKKSQEAKKKPEQKPKQKPPSLIKLLWEDHGYDGLVKMLKDTLSALDTFFGKILYSVVINEMSFSMRVSKGDAAATALEYGKVCAELYPLFGDIVSKLKVRSYDINIYPDYLAGKSEMYLRAKLSVSPRKVLNCGLGLVFRLLFKVVLKLLRTLLFKKPKSSQKNKPIPNISKGGASQ